MQKQQQQLLLLKKGKKHKKSYMHFFDTYFLVSLKNRNKNEGKVWFCIRLD